MYPKADFICSSAKRIYVADFSERTKAVRKVEVHEQVPSCPLRPDQKMDCFVLDNRNSLPIDFHIFAEYSVWHSSPLRPVLRGEELCDHAAHIVDGDELDAVLEFFDALEVLPREDHPLEPHLDAFVDPLFGEGHAAHFAGQADFAEHGGVFVDGDIFISARQRRAHGEVDGGFVEADASHRVEIDVEAGKGERAALFEHGDE